MPDGISHRSATELWAPPATAERAFLGVSASLFAASAAATIAWCASMPATGGIRMPGGWTMSMTWTRMPGQTWPGATLSFLAMWTTMMLAMMLPCLLPMLRRYRTAVRATAPARLGWLTVLVGTGYYFVWTSIGLVVFALGVAAAAIEMHLPALARVVPVTAGVAVLMAGAFQLTRHKSRYLACCRQASPADCIAPADIGAAWRHGVRLGAHCGCCTANLMAVLVVTGMMDLRAMAAATVAVTAERVAPRGERIAHAIGVIVVLIGLVLVARAAGA